MFGREHDEMLDTTFQEITHPDDLAKDLDLVRQCLDGESAAYRLRKRYLLRDGSVMWGDLSVALICDDEGEPERFVSQVLDVTQQVQQQVELEEALAELRRQRAVAEATFDTVDVGLVLIDAHGNYERINRKHAEFMQLAYPYGHEGVAGQTGYVFHADGHTAVEREDMPTHRAQMGEEFEDLRIWVGSDPISRRALSVSARSVDQDGRHTGAALAYKDITDLMRAIRVKDEFVASVSHELRTPLTSVLGYLEILTERTDVAGDVHGALDVVHRNARRLEHLVGDLLQVAQHAEGGVPLERRDVDLVRIVREAVTDVRAQANSRGVTVELDLPESLNAQVDRDRLRQVLDNLLSNGIKYTPSPGTVTVRLAGSADRFELYVEDTGVGFEEFERGHVFERFFRGRRAQLDQIPGSGLGLNIVRSIVLAHGGTITLDSTPGQGSSFRIVIARVAD